MVVRDIKIEIFRTNKKNTTKTTINVHPPRETVAATATKTRKPNDSTIAYSMPPITPSRSSRNLPTHASFSRTRLHAAIPDASESASNETRYFGCFSPIRTIFYFSRLSLSLSRLTGFTTEIPLFFVIKTLTGFGRCQLHLFSSLFIHKLSVFLYPRRYFCASHTSSKKKRSSPQEEEQAITKIE